VRLLVGGYDKTAHARVDRPAVDSGDHAAGRLAEGDTGREVNAVAQVAIGDVAMAPEHRSSIRICRAAGVGGFRAGDAP
jgi:hypothetical protein